MTTVGSSALDKLVPTANLSPESDFPYWDCEIEYNASYYLNLELSMMRSQYTLRQQISSLDTHKRCDENHYSDVIMSAMASQITGVPIVCTAVCSGADKIKHQSSASLVFAQSNAVSHWLGANLDSALEYRDTVVNLLRINVITFTPKCNNITILYC